MRTEKRVVRMRFSYKHRLPSRHRDVERLDTDPYWSPVPVNAIGESSASSHELDALRERPVRWTDRTDMHPFGSRKDEE
ncbi:hypothetical protein PI125_g23120 [Phytophthora idaei]|nr:hypothetical protein PI125_g23120 [Phytophthora idaei]